MKTTIKKTASLTENLIDEKKITGKTISIYLNAESLEFLDKLCKTLQQGRSEAIQSMILQQKETLKLISPKMIEEIFTNLKNQIPEDERQKGKEVTEKTIRDMTGV
jgi:superfamily I DNA and/or RNA helicase